MIITIKKLEVEILFHIFYPSCQVSQLPYLTIMIYLNLGVQSWGILMKLQLFVSETVALVPWLSFPQNNSFSPFLKNCHRSLMSHLNYMWLSEHINEYKSVNLYKYVWIHPILHCFLLSGWMLLVTAAFSLHNTTWGVWLAASGPWNVYLLIVSGIMHCLYNLAFVAMM